MNIVAVMVTSIDGKIFSKEGKYLPWVSKEDQLHFTKLKETFPLLVMGRRTYQHVAPSLIPHPSLRRIVMTRSPHLFTSNTIPGQLEFTDESPDTLTQRLEHEGYSSLLLAGGTDIYSQFINAHLVSEIHLTIEPVLLNGGHAWTHNLFQQHTLSLTHIEQLNTRGTLYTIYKVLS